MQRIPGKPVAAERWQVPEPLAVCEVVAPDGTTLAVRRHGRLDGIRLLFGHGNGFAIDAYYPFWSHFTDRFDVCVYDLRNHGWNGVGSLRRHNLPTFVDDTEVVLRGIDRHFGAKPTVGVFHSLSALMALHLADLAGRGPILSIRRGPARPGSQTGFSALVLFDPPVCPPGGFPSDMEGVGRLWALASRRRRHAFDMPEEYTEYLSRTGLFDRVCPAVLDLLSRTTLRRASGGPGYELRCPRAYEAQICMYLFCWSMTVDLSRVTCPTKVIGADPTVWNSFMPSMDLGKLQKTDYDFVPETSHLLLLEEPGACAALTVEFLEATRDHLMTGRTTG